MTPTAEIFTRSGRTTTAERLNPSAVISAFDSLNMPVCRLSSTDAPQLSAFDIDFVKAADIKKAYTNKKTIEALLHRHAEVKPSKTHHVRVEVAADERASVYLDDLLTRSDTPRSATLAAALGIDTDNRPLWFDLAAAPHLLIAGETGSGKSVLLNSILSSLLYLYTSERMQLLLIDPKQVELTNYDSLPHLVTPPITDITAAVYYLRQACDKMDARYTFLSAHGLKDISGTTYPHLVIVIDELADLMLTSGGAVEPYIIRLAQKGRSAGIHLIIATQRPTVNVITGLIKSNLPCKIALRVASVRDSVTILDHKGAETLTGCGDALLKLADRVGEIRFQSAFLSDENIKRLTDHLKR
jgi:S-DNA-T family DNA segregation ATPase FtsK/SpoIIIE